ncbi:MAG: DMT family transporter [Anaerovoracaceae bacterium]
MDKHTGLKPYFAGICFSFVVGFSFVSVKTCVSYATSLQILTYRFDFALIGILLVLLFSKQKLKLKEKPKGMALLTGFFYIAFIALQTVGLAFSSSIESAILFSIVPVLVHLLATIFLKEKGTPLQTIFMFVCVSTLIYMIVRGATGISFSPLGTALLLLSSLSMAIHNVLTRYVRASYTPFEITTMIIVEGFVFFKVAAVVDGLINKNFAEYFQPFTHIEFTVSIIYLGVFCILISAQLMAYMQGNLPSTNAAIFGNLSTAISIVAGVVLLKEAILPYHIYCSILIIAAVIGMNFSGKRKGLNHD